MAVAADSPWRRLRWTLPTASVLTLVFTVAFLRLLARAPLEAPPAALEARLVELPGPPAAPMPPRPTPPTPRPARPKPRLPSPKPAPAAKRAPPPPPEASTSQPPAEATNAHAAPAPQAPTARSSGSQLPGGRSSARAIYSPMPEIPEALRHRRLGAVAMARFDVAQDGTAQVELVQPTNEPALNRALLETLRTWRFFPALEHGRPVRSSIVIRIPVSVE